MTRTWLERLSKSSRLSRNQMNFGLPLWQAGYQKLWITQKGQCATSNLSSKEIWFQTRTIFWTPIFQPCRMRQSLRLSTMDGSGTTTHLLILLLSKISLTWEGKLTFGETLSSLGTENLQRALLSYGNTWVSMSLKWHPSLMVSGSIMLTRPQFMCANSCFKLQGAKTRICLWWLNFSRAQLNSTPTLLQGWTSMAWFEKSWIRVTQRVWAPTSTNWPAVKLC